MVNHSPSETLSQMVDLLDKERQAMLKGDLDMLTRLIADKERLLEQLETYQPDQKNDLSALRAQVESNQTLLASTLEGVHSVANRLQVLRHVQRSLETYDSLGRRAVVQILGAARSKGVPESDLNKFAMIKLCVFSTPLALEGTW
ncbi:flagellar biosynthesis protein FlgN [uncultured Shimia sp.]|uniref:flagellar biosynthesis protein FlgN n=1 Tax=uncultured Shimia sp. TaxID=573152 RepID=UPI00260BD518|nr:flagellar biosynthesis protein FlgN [uncultured Shimia sp.]